jgi:opacity protein-like surface antigen
MKAKFTLFVLSAVLCLAQENNAAPKNELAFGLGGIPSLSRSGSPNVNAGSGVAFQVNYGRRFLSGNKWALYGEINFVASPMREISSSVNTATHDFASLYITPGIRVKFRPVSRISPYALVGGGYADYETESDAARWRSQPGAKGTQPRRPRFRRRRRRSRMALRRASRRSSRFLHWFAQLQHRVDFGRAAQYPSHGRLRPAVALNASLMMIRKMAKIGAGHRVRARRCGIIPPNEATGGSQRGNQRRRAKIGVWPSIRACRKRWIGKTESAEKVFLAHQGRCMHRR